MNNNLDQRIKSIREKGFHLRTSQIFSETFQLFSRNLFYNGIGILIFMILMGVNLYFINIKYSFLELLQNFSNNLKNLSQSGNVSLLMNEYVEFLNNPNVGKGLFFMFLFSLLLYPLQSGFIYCAYKRDTTGNCSFQDLINGFNGMKYIKLLILIVIYLSLMILSSTFFYLPMLYFGPALLLSGVFISINNISVWDSIKYSVMICNKDFFTLLGFYFIILLLTKILGMFCYLFIITIPFTSIMLYVLYKRILFEQIKG